MRPFSKQRTVETVFILAFAFLWNQAVYWLSRLIASGWYHCDMTTAADRLVPFVPWTVSIYFGCYLLWSVNYLICALYDREERDRYFCADTIAKAVCFILFVAIPTTNIRPVIDGTGLWDSLVRFLYSIDSADNLFPSIHCLASWLCWIGVRGRKNIPLWYRILSLLAASAVCVSTLTTRQHVIADAIVGILIAELCYFISGFPKIRGAYTAMYTRILGIFQK